MHLPEWSCCSLVLLPEAGIAGRSPLEWPGHLQERPEGEELLGEMSGGATHKKH